MAALTSQTFPPIVIRASAGTGKTYQLSNRYLALLQAEVPPEQILATTFTRKAAGEILDRVLLRLADAARNERARRDLVAALDDENFTRERCLQLLERLVQNLHRVRVCTLDAFFAQVASSLSLELGLPLGWTILEPPDERRLKARAIDAVLGNDSEQEVLRLMHLMTKGEAQRSITELLRTTVENLYAVFQESDERAWRNFPEPRLLDQAQRLDVLDRLAQAELPQHKKVTAARDRDVATAVAEDWPSFLERGLAKKIAGGDFTFCGKTLPDDVVHLYEQLIAHATGLELLQLRHHTGATFELLNRFDELYREIKRESRGLRFEDVTRSLSRRLSDVDASRLEFRLDAPLAHLLLDEFQDTSSLQWQVLAPLARRVAPDSPADDAAAPLRSFFCVGDVKQAIYGWRGGRAAIFDALESQLPGLERLALARSFRSSPVIMEVVNQVFQQLHQHPRLERHEGAVRDWVRQFQAHTTAREDLPGYVTLETCGDDEETGEEPVDDSDAPASRPMAYAARRVAELVEQVPGRSIGVLVRSNKGVAETIFELRRLGVAASEEGGNPLIDSAPVTAILSLLRLADHTGDTIARFHVASSPLGRVLAYLDWQDDRATNRLAAAVREQLVRQGYGPTIRQWVQRIEAEATSRDQNRLRQLVEAAFEYEPRATLRPSDFCDLIIQNRAADPSAANVRVMTIHQSKGLQFDIVVLPELHGQLRGQTPTHVVHQPDPMLPIERVCKYCNAQMQSVLPAEMQAMFDQQARQTVMESLCVLYVALTRAVHAMHLVIAPSAANERGLPVTLAGLLRATLTAGAPLPADTLAFECGDRHWWRQLEPAAARTHAERKPVKISFATAAPAALQPTAPSMLEGGARASVHDLVRVENSAALARGTAIHALFEQIQWLEDGVPGDAQLASALQECGTPVGQIERLLREFREMLRQPAIAELLQRQRYLAADGGLSLEVHNERRIAVRDRERLLSGSIDRLVLIKQGARVLRAEILDYKTDVIPAGDATALAQRVEHYRPQQEAYRTALARMYGLPEDAVAAQLLFVALGRVERLA